jgi:hypothetical protein
MSRCGYRENKKNQISAEICDLIENAMQYIVMITSYVNLWTQLKVSIEVTK